MNFFDSISLLPKTDLHVHLDGSMRIETLIDLAKENNINLPTDNPIELSKRLGFYGKYTSLEDCLKVFALTTSVMQDEKALYRIAYELVEDAAKENIRYMEVRFAPHLHTNKGLTSTKVLSAVLHAFRDAELKFKIESKVIICGIRNMSADLSVEMAELAGNFRSYGVVAFDLAGAENGFPPSLHSTALKIARDGGLGITIHAGESAGPDYIKEAIEYGATRIGHGCSILEDDVVMQEIINNDIVVECCISSNWQTGAIKTYSDHPIEKLFEAGIKCTINTDNRLVHNTTVSEELQICYNELACSENTIRQLIKNGFDAKF